MYWLIKNLPLNNSGLVHFRQTQTMWWHQLEWSRSDLSLQPLKSDLRNRQQQAHLSGFKWTVIKTNVAYRANYISSFLLGRVCWRKSISYLLCSFWVLKALWMPFWKWLPVWWLKSLPNGNASISARLMTQSKSLKWALASVVWMPAFNIQYMTKGGCAPVFKRKWDFTSHSKSLWINFS